MEVRTNAAEGPAPGVEGMWGKQKLVAWDTEEHARDEMEKRIFCWWRWCLYLVCGRADVVTTVAGKKRGDARVVPDRSMARWRAVGPQ